MPAKDLGTKHTCFKCQTKFYDLRKAEPICPKCGADQRQTPATKPSTAAEKRSRPKPAPAPVVPDTEEAAEAVEVDEDDVEADDDADEDDDDEGAEEDRPRA